MGIMDLSTNLASRKHVDFNDARYQLSDKLRFGANKTVRSTFTLYDNRERNREAVQDISAAYALSDKKLPMGELLNKMVDLIIDLEDGVLDTEKDAIYTWKYSNAILEMYEDKIKRQEGLASFDNSLKSSLINSPTFIERYPGKYTYRTNFFDKHIKSTLASDVIDTFRNVALPKIHNAAIEQSRVIAEKHNNPTLDKIVNWAMANYGCDVDSFYQVREDKATDLYFSINTVIIHLNNGYDMSIIGHVGTDYDDKFAISIFDAQKITIQKHGSRLSTDEIHDAIKEATKHSPIDPLKKLLSAEKKKNAILKDQYSILTEIRPMIPSEALALLAAEDVVGPDYIWGCQQFRTTHNDLPADFKLEDVELPQYEDIEIEMLSEEKQEELLSTVSRMADHMEAERANAEEVQEKVKTAMQDAGVDETITADEVEQVRKEAEEEAKKTPTKPTIPTGDIALPELEGFTQLFDLDEKKEKVENNKKFGENESFNIPILDTVQPTKPMLNEKKDDDVFDYQSALLLGTPEKIEKKTEDLSNSVTGNAKPMPVEEKPVFEEIGLFDNNDTSDLFENPTKQNDEKKPVDLQEKTEIKPTKPDIDFDDIGSLFD